MRQPSSCRKRRRLSFNIYLLVLTLILALALTGVLAQSALAQTYTAVDGDQIIVFTASDPEQVPD